MTNPHFGILTSRFCAKAPKLTCFRTRRFYSQRVLSHSEHYTLLEDVSFVKPPTATNYGSSTDPIMDTYMKAMTHAFHTGQLTAEPSPEEQSMVRNNPWKFRIVIHEHDCQAISENKTGTPDQEVTVTLQRGLRASDHGPAMMPTKPGILNRLRSWAQNDKSDPDKADTTTKEWRHYPSWLTFSDWLANEEGRLALPLLQRSSVLTTERDRTRLAQLDGNIDDKLPFECANAIIFLYSLARSLSITPLETHLAAKWRQSFDIMPENCSVYIWAINVLSETASIEDPLISRLIHQLAYSLLWKADLINDRPDLATPDMFLAAISTLSATIMPEFTDHQTFLRDRLNERMTKIIHNVAAQQSSQICDFVKAEPLMIYGD